jgi:hypothetical protein
MPTYGAVLSKISNPYDKFRQTVGGDSGKGRPFVAKFRLEPVDTALGRLLIVKRYLERGVGYCKFLGF